GVHDRVRVGAVAEADGVADLVRGDFGEVRRDAEEALEVAVEDDVAFKDLIEQLAADAARRAAGAGDAADGERAAATDRVAHLVERVVEGDGRDAIALKAERRRRAAVL